MRQEWSRLLRVMVLAPLGCLSGCMVPIERISFPGQPLTRTSEAWRYDVNKDGAADFALLADESGRFDLIAYDDDEDGIDDRIYRLSEYDNDHVPHVIILLDSIPYRTVKARYDRGDFAWLNPPAKVIPPFPSMSEVIFAKLLHTAPQPGMINRHFDRAHNKIDNMIVQRVFGKPAPMDSRLDYRIKYWESGLMFLYPKRWFRAELYRVKKAIDDNPLPVSILYFASTAGVLSKYGEAGANESLDGIIQLCMQLLYERQGAVKISILADHGHNYIEGRRFDIAAVLEQAGFTSSDHIDDENDVVIDVDGMVNYSGLHTRRPADVVRALVPCDPIQTASYMQGEEVIVQDRQGMARILKRDGLFQYEVVTHDVLGYEPVMQRLREQGEMDEDGFASADAWFAATYDHQYPDAVVRLWHGFHGLVINTPDVLVTMQDGYYYGLSQFESYVTMVSTHGGLDQDNSATFVMSMTNRVKGPMRSHEVMPAIEPRFVRKNGAQLEGH